MIAIYDIAGGHYNTVKSTLEHYYSGAMPIGRVWYGFGIYGENIRDYVKDNNVKVLVVPYANVGKGFNMLTDLGCTVIIPCNQHSFESAIRVSGGDTENNQITDKGHGLDFYSECANLTGAQRFYPSYVSGKVGGLIANLIDSGYNLWEARQILRQNSDAYNSYSKLNGFGKLPDTITIPQVIHPMHPVDIKVTTYQEGVNNVANFGIGFIDYRSPDGVLQDQSGDFITSESPLFIVGENKNYSLNFNNGYSALPDSLFQHDFYIPEYEYTKAPNAPSIVYYRKIYSNNRIIVGCDDNWNIVEGENYDQIKAEVYLNDVLVYDWGWMGYNRNDVLLESYNSPDFYFNGSGNRYHFKIKYRNIFGESEWSDYYLTDGGIPNPVLVKGTNPEPEPEPPTPPEPPTRIEASAHYFL